MKEEIKDPGQELIEIDEQGNQVEKVKADKKLNLIIYINLFQLLLYLFLYYVLAIIFFITKKIIKMYLMKKS